jgi:hypothetical protein
MTASPRSVGSGALADADGWYRRAEEYADRISLGIELVGSFLCAPRRMDSR